MANTVRKNFPVTGMGCAACVARVQKALQQSPGVHEAEVSLASNSARIDYDPAVASPATLRRSVQDAGYDMIVPEDEDADPDLSEEESLAAQAEQAHERAFRSLRRDALLAIFLAVAVMAVGMAAPDFPGKGWILAALAAVSVLWCGRRFFSVAWKQAVHGHAGMDTLVALSVGISFLLSLFNLLFPQVWTSRGLEAGLYFESSAMIVGFILLGRLLEERAKHRTTRAVRALIGLQPERKDVRRGQTVQVLPGERIPADGTVLGGSSYVDESMLTGEPVAVFKEAGSTVYAGTLNGRGALTLRADQVGRDTMLSAIIRMVQDAQGSKARIQHTVDRVCAWFVPAVILIALLSLLGWTLLSPDGFVRGLLAAVTVLVVACPCSLGLATPTALTAGIGRGASDGILIKDADSLQLAARIDTVVLDKTGTVTSGRPEVVELRWLSSDPDLPALLREMEARSGHPLGAAIACAIAAPAPPAAFTSFNVQPTSVTALLGEGVQGVWKGKTYYVGKNTPERFEVAQRWRDAGRTVVYFHDGEHLLAAIAIADAVKEDSRQAVRDLARLGITVHLLTGDHDASAAAVAREVGIPEVKANAMPADKVAYIKQLQAQGKRVAMVGDGINDSAALAQADLSVAMGKGSDIAIHTAMATIVSSSLAKIPELIALSRRTLRIIRENLGWAFLYNLIAVPVATGVFSDTLGFVLNPMVAAAAMACSSVLVVSNSLRLLIKKP
ncbi:MAG: heavy metal translocating P-type ATPase [Bacteroidales bacterium]|nr:heavy metal translocating P-type ATPase [Bacteroidales bacterium]